MSTMVGERELSFLLYEMLDTARLVERPRYAEHSREVFDATLDTARRIAAEHFAPHDAEGDRREPEFRDGRAVVIPEVGAAWRAFADAGFLGAHWNEDEGGLQLPEVVLRAALTAFFSSNVSTAGYPFLTIGAANLLRAFGSPAQKALYLPALSDGRSAGTMALTEPGQGSALGDIRTLATLQDDGSYRIVGSKMFISGGDQDFTGNIVHMVLARIRGAASGPKGISLFLVPKFIVDADGQPGARNDVALAGLLHKMGWHGTTSTVLSFGEQGGATGYLLGEANKGLAQMFQMMNEARIGVGLIASCLAWRGFAESLAYARERSQGRLPSSKDPASKQVRLIDHADVRRLLLAQKAYAEASLALCLYASSLFEDQHTHPDAGGRERALLLLDVLTPVVKSWPSRYGCVANDMAMQVLGGAGYTRDYPLEQLYRDQRLNPIHEGAEAIHGLDLLGRKVGMKGGTGFRLFCETVRADIEGARGRPALVGLAQALSDALDDLDATTAGLLATLATDPDLALANATLYLDAFGTVTAAWMWLKQAVVADAALAAGSRPADDDYYRGKRQAAQWFFHWELPKTAASFTLLQRLDRLPLDMQDRWFQ